MEIGNKAREKKNKAHEKAAKAVKSIVITRAAFVAAFLVMKFVMAQTIVNGNSMYPTLENADALLILKVPMKYKRFDIIVFNSSFSDTEMLIKRVIGLPGENVKIDPAGKVYINDEELTSDIYGAATIVDSGLAASEDGGVDLKEDEYFVMGDNRNRSEDSRFGPVGSIKAKDIEGKVLIRLTPIRKFGDVDLYRERALAY